MLENQLEQFMHYLGEGIIPSMQCVEIFLENMHDFAAYEKAVEKHYKVYAKVFNFVRAKIHKNFSFLQSITRLYLQYFFT